MKKYLFLALTLLCAGGLIAQTKKIKPPAPELNSEDSGVVVDSKSEDIDAETFSDFSDGKAEQQKDADFDSSIPASYGQLKGVLNEPGRNVLVFENEDGVLSFVQASFGRNSLTCKLLARAGRSQD